MRIGILGGSFDPIHKGHLHMAKSAYDTGNFDEIWLMPAGHSPNKKEENMTSPEHRLAMCQLAAKEYAFLRASSFEVDSSDRRYTYLTLKKLSKQYPQHRFSFIMGADSLDYFEEWKNPEEIARLCPIYVINRGEFSKNYLEDKIQKLNELFPAEIYIVPCRKYHISSSEIRSNLERNCNYAGYLPEAVVDYIRKNHLYGFL